MAMQKLHNKLTTTTTTFNCTYSKYKHVRLISNELDKGEGARNNEERCRRENIKWSQEQDRSNKKRENTKHTI